MDVAEVDKDVQLQKQSAEYLADLERSLPPFLWRVGREGHCQSIRQDVRVRDTDRLVDLVCPQILLRISANAPP
jgi:hypothetical protein